MRREDRLRRPALTRPTARDARHPGRRIDAERGATAAHAGEIEAMDRDDPAYKGQGDYNQGLFSVRAAAEGPDGATPSASLGGAAAQDRSGRSSTTTR